jgi:hypothetical protein
VLRVLFFQFSSVQWETKVRWMCRSVVNDSESILEELALGEIDLSEAVCRLVDITDSITKFASRFDNASSL